MKYLLKILLPCQFTIFIFTLTYSTCFADEGIALNRLRFSPQISISEKYTDNVFLTEKEGLSDGITTLSPKLSVDFAISQEHFINLSYEAEYLFYGRHDNLNKDIHRTALSWTWQTPKGTKIMAGAKADYDFIQPFSDLDIQKDFVTSGVYVDSLLKLASYTDIALKYEHISREFRNAYFKEDEYENDSITVDIIYTYWAATALIVSYDYFHQENNQLSDTIREMETHIISTGLQWEPTSKLRGYFKAGYYQTSIENEIDSNGFAMDTDLIYRLSDFIQLKTAAFRKTVRSTIAARESGNFYISTGGSLSASYRKWEPLVMTQNLSYINNEFKGREGSLNTDRKDDLYSADTRVKYFIQDGLSFMVSYQYKKNDSNFINRSYRENRVEAKIEFAI